MMKHMIKKIKIHLSDNSGEFYIQTLIGIFIILIILMIGFALTPVMLGKIKTDYAADEIARYVSLTGDSNIREDDIQGIIDAYNIKFSDVKITADSPKGVGETRIQLADGFSVTIIHPMTVSLGGSARSFTVNITSSARGRSEVYWKELDEP